MAAAYAAYPDVETKLFYGLALLGTVKEGSKGFERQGLAAKLFEEVYAKTPQHPGVLHYLIHVLIEMMTEAVAIEDAIEALSQPPYPIIPAHEVYGTLLMEMKRPTEAAKHFAETLRRTPGRPMAVYGIARAAQALGDRSTALARYSEFLELWKQADPDRPELAIARRFVSSGN